MANSNPFSDISVFFEPRAIGDFIRCFDSSGSDYWLSFINIERAYLREDELYVFSTSQPSEPLLVARLKSEHEAKQSLFVMLNTISKVSEKENES